MSGARDPAAAQAARVWRGLRQLVLERNDRRRAVCEALGMSFIRAKALRLLSAGPMTMRDLAAELPADAPYTTLVVDDLERRGLAGRAVHPADRRSKIVTLTPAGAEAAGRAERILGEPPAALRDLDPADLAALDRIVTALLGEPEPAPQRPAGIRAQAT
ncbi:MAG TPA: MarR family transcriptional regulator [Streptosporangiaceae bacterium]|nr:MarR family transcriptional regulator [Streptosporangiaceae bacterium]